MQEQQGNLMPKLSGLPGPRPYSKRGKMKNKQQQLAEFLGTAIGLLSKTKVGRGAVKGGLKVVNKAKKTKTGKRVSDFANTDLGGAVVGNVATAAPGWAIGKVQQVRARKQAEAEERRQRAEQKKRKRASAWDDGDIEKEEMNESRPAIIPGVDVPPGSQMGRDEIAKQRPKVDRGEPDGLAKPTRNAPSQVADPSRNPKHDSFWKQGIDFVQKLKDYRKGSAQHRAKKSGRPETDFYRPGSVNIGTGKSPTKPSGMGPDLRKRNSGMKEQKLYEARVMSAARGSGAVSSGMMPGGGIPTQAGGGQKRQNQQNTSATTPPKPVVTKITPPKASPTQSKKPAPKGTKHPGGPIRPVHPDQIIAARRSQHAAKARPKHFTHVDSSNYTPEMRARHNETMQTMKDRTAQVKDKIGKQQVELDRHYRSGHVNRTVDKNTGKKTYSRRPQAADSGRVDGGKNAPINWGTGKYAGTIKGRHDAMAGIDHPIARREQDRYQELNKVRRGAMPQWQRDMEDAEFLKQQNITKRIQRRNRGY